VLEVSIEYERTRTPKTNRRFARSERAKQAALGLVAALAAVLVIHLTIGLNDVLLFGLVGGLLGSLVVIGLDLLRNAQRAIESSLPAPRDTDSTRGMRR
jgi:hypothetical protein